MTRDPPPELDALTRALDSRPELRAAAPCDEVESETLALQYELLWQSQANRAVLSAVLKRVAARCEEEGETFARVEGDVAEAAQMMSKVREVRRMLKREKREADQRAALERAAAAAAASSRVGAQRRDADGNVIAPAMGALDGLPPDVVAAALGRAEEEATRRAARERERREAAENAPKLAKQKRAAESYKPPPPMTDGSRPRTPRQPEKAGNAPAASVSARSATPETPVAAAGSRRCSRHPRHPRQPRHRPLDAPRRVGGARAVGGHGARRRRGWRGSSTGGVRGLRGDRRSGVRARDDSVRAMRAAGSPPVLRVAARRRRRRGGVDVLVLQRRRGEG